MRLVLALLAGLIPLGTAWGQPLPVPVAQVAMQPLPETETPDVEALVRQQWKAYYNGGGSHAFYRGDVRVGRMDLNGDGVDELFVLIDSPAWVSAKGQPLLVARWTTRGWRAIGWSFADSDSVFLGRDVNDGWRSVLTPVHVMRWNGTDFTPTERSIR